MSEREFSLFLLNKYTHEEIECFIREIDALLEMIKEIKHDYFD
ncbi:hypothetical protein [Gracilibacillus salinarum]|nr:hypothetical protein [Gracilibacillus salinarum]